MPDDHRSAQEAGADGDPLGGGLDPASGLWCKPRVIWGDSSQRDREPGGRRHNDNDHDQQQSPCPPWDGDGADALGDAQIQRQSREVGKHSEQPGGEQGATAYGQRIIFVATR
jgi:hypothetical protein